jgi:uncharacterized membrane protein
MTGKERGLSRSANSVFLYGIYIIILGAAFLLVPNLCLELMGMNATSEVWIRVVGWFGIWLGIYYVVSARSESKAFILTSVYGRPTFLIFLGVLVALGMIGPIILIIGAIDLLTALWTYSLLRKEKIQHDAVGSS